jgi:hypothetical protein
MRESGPLLPAGISGIGACPPASGLPSLDFGLRGAAGASGRYGDSMCIGASVAGWAGIPSLSMYASTSCLRTRPPRPVPSTWSRSMSCSAAIRITTGE